MKKFFAILLGIVDVFCVGLIFYLMLSLSLIHISEPTRPY